MGDMLIRRYIMNNFEINIGDNINILDKTKKIVITLNQLISDTHQIFQFGDVNYIINKWYKQTLNYKTKDLNDYLSQYHVRLTQTEWVCINKHGELLSISDMVNKFGDKYSEKFIRAIQNEWYLNKIHKYVGNIMKFDL